MTNESNHSPNSQSLYRKVLHRDSWVISENSTITSPSTELTYQELTNVTPPPCLQNKDVSNSDSHLSNYPHLPSSSNISDHSAELLPSRTAKIVQDYLDLRTNKIKVLEQIVIPAQKK